jgi:agmatine deiminase
MSKFVTIGLVQNAVGEDIQKNIDLTTKLIKQAAKKGAQIISLQELFQTPYFPQKEKQNKDDFAETLTGPTITKFSDLAKQLKITLIIPFYEKKSGNYFNTAVVVGPNGKPLGHYHKIHIPHDPGFYEKEYFEHGQAGYKIFSSHGAKFAVLICYDQWFPEAAREARLAGAEIIFYPTAIGHIAGYNAEGDWHDAWETIMRGHAIANSVYVAAANRVGKEGKMIFWGQSFVSDPFGKLLKVASQDKDEAIVVKVDKEKNKFYSEGWGFMRNRRPDTYKNITSNKLIIKSKKLQNVKHYEDEKRALGEK